MDLFPISLPADTLRSTKLRLEPVRSDTMEPTFRGGRDFALCMPTNRYECEGIYLLELSAGSTELYRCEARPRGGVCLTRDNPAYRTAFIISRAEFDSSVLAIVIADVKVRADHLLRGAVSWGA